jgi:transposase
MYSNPTQWRRIRKAVLVTGESMRSVAKKEGMSRTTLRKILSHELPPGYGGHGNPSTAKRHPAVQLVPKSSHADIVRQQWNEWLYGVERGKLDDDALASGLSGCGDNARKKILVAMARRDGFSSRAIAGHLGLAMNTVRRYADLFDAGGIASLLGRKPRARMADDEAFGKALFGLLHEPPSLSGHNRTTWRMEDLQKTLAERGFRVGREIIREAIRKSGFRWRSAKVVLTSHDPEYREKLARVREVLSNLDDDERFFSVDEYGPFAIKAKPGRVLGKH